jgi:hypothetical protein
MQDAEALANLCEEPKRGRRQFGAGVPILGRHRPRLSGELDRQSS